MNGFFFTMCIAQHLGILERLRDIPSVLEGYTSTVCIQRFCRRLPSFQINGWQFPHELYCLFCPIFSEVSDIVAWLLYSSALFWRQPCNILVPWLPVQKGIQSSWRYYFTNASNAPGSLIPDFWFYCSVTKKILTGCIPLSTAGFTL